MGNKMEVKGNKRKEKPTGRKERRERKLGKNGKTSKKQVLSTDIVAKQSYFVAVFIAHSF
jgi:hypothetical protein